MKLPEDKKERTKILALIGIGAVVIVVLIFQLPVVGILPLIKSKKEKTAKIEELKINIEKADREVKQQEKDKVENLDALQKIRDVSDKHVLVPELGNYEIPAGNYIDSIARKLNLKVDQKRQQGISGETGQTYFNAFSLKVSLECSYDKLTSFIKEVEDGNPLISVVNITVTGQSPEKKEQHLISFDVQWPVWTLQETPTKIAQQIKDLSGNAGVSSK